MAAVFDLDFTLIKSDAKIYVYRNEAFYKSLNSKQYNTFVKQPDDVLDFREFKDGDFILNAKHYKMWPFLKKLNHLVKEKKIDADIYILTARSSLVKADIYTLFKEDGIILDMKHIITLGDDRGELDVSEEKKKVLETLIKRYSQILFFDDDIKNIQIANKIKGVQTKLVESTLDEAIKHLTPRSSEEIIVAAKNEAKEILKSKQPFSLKIILIKDLVGDLRILSKKQRDELMEDTSPTQKLQAAFILKIKNWQTKQ